MLVLRPAAVTLAEVTPEAGRRPIAATVIDRAYRGIGYDHVVRTPLATLTGMRYTAPRSRGETCQILLDPQGCFAFPRDPTVSNSR